MNRPELRHPDLVQRLPLRDHLRANCPTGKDGYVVEDLDLVLRVYGPRYHVDGIGRLRLVETKYGLRTPLENGQMATFRLMDRLMRHGDECGRYNGFYLVRTNGEWTDPGATFNVNGLDMDAAAFLAWCRWETDAPPYNFVFRKGR